MKILLVKIAILFDLNLSLIKVYFNVWLTGSEVMKQELVGQMAETRMAERTYGRKTYDRKNIWLKDI